MFIQQLTIIGVGLIGGSLARALRRVEMCGEIIGCGRDTANLQQAVKLGVIDSYTIDPAQAVKGSDMVVIAVPLGAVATILAIIHEKLLPHAIVTDVGSAKMCVVTDARQQFSEHITRFVPGHPIAGTEKSGVTASFAELFEKRRVILTPLPETNLQAYNKVAAMWQYTGAEVVNMTPEYHDTVLAATSHLPHLLAYTLVDTLTCMDKQDEIFRFAAGGFRDFTRIASSDPTMWHDICLGNRDAILTILEHFDTDLRRLAVAIRQGDSHTILDVFQRAKTARDRFYG